MPPNTPETPPPAPAGATPAAAAPPDVDLAAARAQWEREHKAALAAHEKALRDKWGIESDDDAEVLRRAKAAGAATEPPDKRAQREIAKREERIKELEEASNASRAAMLEMRVASFSERLAARLRVHEGAERAVAALIERGLDLDGDKAIFVDGKARFPLDDDDALAKVADHLAKAHPYLLPARMPGGGGTGHGGTATAPEDAWYEAKDPAERRRRLAASLGKS